MFGLGLVERPLAANDQQVEPGSNSLNYHLMALDAIGKQEKIVLDCELVPLRLLQEQRLDHPQLSNVGISGFHVCASIDEELLHMSYFRVQGTATGRFAFEFVFDP